jgi:hypothetical protein
MERELVVGRLRGRGRKEWGWKIREILKMTEMSYVMTMVAIQAYKFVKNSLKFVWMHLSSCKPMSTILV